MNNMNHWLTTSSWHAEDQHGGQRDEEIFHTVENAGIESSSCKNAIETREHAFKACHELSSKDSSKEASTCFD